MKPGKLRMKEEGEIEGETKGMSDRTGRFA
jgi:hypothetical protein